MPTNAIDDPEQRGSLGDRVLDWSKSRRGGSELRRMAQASVRVMTVIQYKP